MYYSDHMGYFGGFWMILLLGLFVWFIVWLTNKSREGDNKRDIKDKTPLQIAKERYAKGEITKKEFNDMVAELKA